MLRGNARQPLRGDERPAGEKPAKSRLTQVAQLGCVGIPVLRFSPGSGVFEHRLANGRLDTSAPIRISHVAVDPS
jgi:hypothetical protein